MEENNLQNVEISQSVFLTKESFEHVQRVASMFSKSDMVPKRYQNNMGNCIIAIEMANRMNANILMVMQNLDVIQGKPGWSSVFLIATLNSCGKFSPLRYEEDEQNGGRTRAWAIDKVNNEKVFGAWVSMEMANAEGWINKPGSKWKTMPEVMRRYRAASFFTKQFAPEVSMGLQTIEEVIDITDKQPQPTVNKEHERIIVLINECNTKKELIDLQEAFIFDKVILTDEQQSVFNQKMEALANGK